jgi:hypothetical protein
MRCDTAFRGRHASLHDSARVDDVACLIQVVKLMQRLWMSRSSTLNCHVEITRTNLAGGFGHRNPNHTQGLTLVLAVQILKNPHPDLWMELSIDKTSKSTIVRNSHIQNHELWCLERCLARAILNGSMPWLDHIHLPINSAGDVLESPF